MFKKLVTIITVLLVVVFSVIFLQKYIPYLKLIQSSPYHKSFFSKNAKFMMNNNSESTEVLKSLN
jgi:hypothetical protein